MVNMSSTKQMTFTQSFGKSPYMEYICKWSIGTNYTQLHFTKNFIVRGMQVNSEFGFQIAQMTFVEEVLNTGFF